MDTQQLGQLGELRAQYDFIKAGWEVSIPIGCSRSYDIVVNKDKTFLKIQVKTAEYIKDGIMIFYVEKKNKIRRKSYSEDDCDYFYLYCLEIEQGYLIPISEVNMSKFILRQNIPKNNQVKGIHFAKDFEFDKIINSIS